MIDRMNEKVFEGEVLESVSMAKAYASGAYSMREIADYFGVHYMTVSRAVRRSRDL